MTPIEQAKAALGNCRNYFGEHDGSIRHQLLFAECSDAIRALSTIEGSEPTDPDQHLSDPDYMEAKRERFKNSEWGKMTSEEIDQMLSDLRNTTTE